MNRKVLIAISVLLVLVTLYLVALSILSYSKDGNNEHLYDALIWVPISAVIIIGTLYIEKKHSAKQKKS